MAIDPPGSTEVQAYTWTQPFRWGLLLAFDNEHDWELPDGLGGKEVLASATCVAVPVHHAQDVEILDDWPDHADIPEALVEVTAVVGDGPALQDSVFEGIISCPSGRLTIGDAENERAIEVPSGSLRIQVSLAPREYADSVVLRIAEHR